MQSFANFNMSVKTFGKLVDTSQEMNSMVRTKNAGIFMRHNKINHGLKNRLGENKDGGGDKKKFKVKNQKMNAKVKSLANMIESSDSESSGDQVCSDRF